jgi:hypothetical protein
MTFFDPKRHSLARAHARALTLTLSLFCTFTACSDAKENDGPGRADTAAAVTDATSCEWPASLDAPAERGACHAARWLLQCDIGGGGHAICLSDDPHACPNAEAQSSCTSRCKADEYAISCGAVGPSSTSYDPPAGCHDEAPTPGGVVFYCCPCAGG